MDSFTMQQRILAVQTYYESFFKSKVYANATQINQDLKAHRSIGPRDLIIH